MNGFVQAGGTFATMWTKESTLSGLSMSAPFTDGVRRCSRKTHGRIHLRPDPSLESSSRLVLLPRYILDLVAQEALGYLVHFVSICCHHRVPRIPGASHLLGNQVKICTANYALDANILGYAKSVNLPCCL